MLLLDAVYKRYDLVPDLHGDVVISAAILNLDERRVQLAGSRKLRATKDEDMDLTGRRLQTDRAK
jgi:hypothetical protein